MKDHLSLLAASGEAGDGYTATSRRAALGRYRYVIAQPANNSKLSLVRPLHFSCTHPLHSEHSINRSLFVADLVTSHSLSHKTHGHGRLPAYVFVFLTFPLHREFNVILLF